MLRTLRQEKEQAKYITRIIVIKSTIMILLHKHSLKHLKM
ncbi:hypothetical protein ERHA55_47920 [Erwinia rhapontici]|nr:hypothetical protein ERHA55_47920 [Erwinia rhapontici]